MQIEHLECLGKPKCTQITIASSTIIIKNKQILLAIDIDEPLWKFPGGVVTDDESLIHTAKRETYEEVGLTVTIKNNQKPIVFTYMRGSEFFVVFQYQTIKADGELSKKDGDILDLNYFPSSDLPENLAPNIKPVLLEIGFFDD